MTEPRAIDLVIALVQQTAECHRARAIPLSRGVKERVDPTVLAQSLEQFRQQRLLPLLHSWEVAQEKPYVLAFVGLTNVGKSTILHALFREKLTKTGNGPTTAFPTWFGYGQSWRVELGREGARIGRHPTTSAKEVLALLDSGATASPRGSTRIEWGRVSGPIELLKDGLEIVDTPGFGAAQIGADVGSHDASLEQFLKQRIHQIFLVVAAAAGEWTIKPNEVRYYEMLRNSCGHIVVNKWRGTEDEKSEYRSKYQGLFPNADFLFVNAKGATMHARDDEVAALTRAIRAAADPAARVEECARELGAMMDELCEHFKHHHGLKCVPWLKGAFDRLVFHTPEAKRWGYG
jgi:GTP-binding protein EngB required for normal cell division